MAVSVSACAGGTDAGAAGANDLVETEAVEAAGTETEASSAEDTADEAYEWMMGVTRSGLSDEEKVISDKLAEAFASYINSAGIKDPDGNVLTLKASSEGIYQAGSYYDYMKSEKMYTPLYYLLESSDGYGSSSVAKYWRIRTGIAQGDCALSTEMNLALALQNYSSVKSVDFETIWGEGHTEAERLDSCHG